MGNYETYLIPYLQVDIPIFKQNKVIDGCPDCYFETEANYCPECGTKTVENVKTGELVDDYLVYWRFNERMEDIFIDLMDTTFDLEGQYKRYYMMSNLTEIPSYGLDGEGVVEVTPDMIDQAIADFKEAHKKNLQWIGWHNAEFPHQEIRYEIKFGLYQFYV